MTPYEKFIYVFQTVTFSPFIKINFISSELQNGRELILVALFPLVLSSNGALAVQDDLEVDVSLPKILLQPSSVTIGFSF